MRALNVVFVLHSTPRAHGGFEPIHHYAVELLQPTVRDVLGWSPILQLTTRKKSDPKRSVLPTVRPFEFRHDWIDDTGTSYPKTIWRPNALLLIGPTEASKQGESTDGWSEKLGSAIEQLFYPNSKTLHQIRSQYGVLRSEDVQPALRNAEAGSVISYGGRRAVLLTDERIHREHRLGFALAAPLLPIHSRNHRKGVLVHDGERIAYEFTQSIEPKTTSDLSLNDKISTSCLRAARRAFRRLQLQNDLESVLPYADFARSELEALSVSPVLGVEALANPPEHDPPHIRVTRPMARRRGALSVLDTGLVGTDRFEIPAAAFDTYLHLERVEDSVAVIAEGRASELEAAWFETSDGEEPEPALEPEPEGYFRIPCGNVHGNTLDGLLVLSYADGHVAALRLSVSWHPGR